MFITEKKRSVYDEKGALYKIDVLRSIRRKDAPQSLIRAIEEQDSEKQIQQEGESFLKKTVEIVLIAIIIGACCLLVYNLTTSSGTYPQRPSTHAVGVGVAATAVSPSLEGVAEWLGVQEGREELIRQFISGSKCGIVDGGILSCEVSLSALGVKTDQ